MSFPHRLEYAFIPRSVAVVGASDRIGSRGTLVWNGVMNSRRVMQAFPVNPKYKYIGLTPCWPRLADLPEIVDLVVIATPSEKVVTILHQCAKLGIAHVLVTPGEDDLTSDRLWRRKITSYCTKHGIRLIGPDSTGIMRPKIGLNVSYWPELPKTGHVGLLCQSGSITSAVLDFSSHCLYGFSSVLTSGMECDVTVSDMLDFLTADSETEIIALHVEAITYPRRFFSALRAASKVKPVILLKSGRSSGAARIIASRLAASACDDAAFDAMLARTGAIRCDRIEDFCSSIELFSSRRSAKEGRLAVLGNGLGLAALAADSAERLGVLTARLSEKTRTSLESLTRSSTTLINPIDLGSEASPELYAQALSALLADDEVDAAMLVIASSVSANTKALAQTLAPIIRHSEKPVCIGWAGATIDDRLRTEFSHADVCCIASIDTAMSAFARLAEYERLKQRRLMPPSQGSEVARHDFTKARDIIEEARQQKRNRLSPEQCERLLKEVGIACVNSVLVTSAKDAVAVSKRIGAPVTLKLCAEGLEHRVRIGGIIINSENVAEDFSRLKLICSQFAAMSQFSGVLVQKTVNRPNARQLSLSMSTDPTLGPVIALGLGGQAGELFEEKTYALAPLTEPLARDMVQRAHFFKTLEAFRGMPEINFDALVHTIIELSRLICEIPAIAELSVDPLWVDEKAALCLDASIGLCARATTQDPTSSHMLIPPTPVLRQTFSEGKGLLRIRAVRADDFNAMRDFFKQFPEQQFSSGFSVRTQADIIDITQPDFDRERVIVAVDSEFADARIQAIAKLVIQTDATEAEFSVLVAEPWQATGIATRLLELCGADMKTFGLSKMIARSATDDKESITWLTKNGFKQRKATEKSASQIFFDKEYK